MFDVIMVPVDGSEYGYKAAEVAIEIAAKFSSKIAAVHVLGEFSFNSYDSEEDSGDDYEEESEDEGGYSGQSLDRVHGFRALYQSCEGSLSGGE